MNTCKPLIFDNFDNDANPISQIKNRTGSQQSKYLYKYLRELGASKVIVEQNYFDRDYLSEFSAFYCLSAKGYSNVCQRVHFFSSDDISRELFVQATGGDEESKQKLEEFYLGFCVIRPIESAPFGRTVLRWYEDRTKETPRVTNPSRTYVCNIAGLELTVDGLAWQQQDTGVAACATIGIWTMLHSSAFDARHAIPTTAMITEAAHQSVAVGTRVYPSYSLNYIQIQEAINNFGFSPSLSQGNLPGGFYSKELFANTCAAYIRSGYPILIGGLHSDGVAVGHAICAVGFREAPPRDDLDPSRIHLQDDHIEYIYIHDDNIGPNVRFRLTAEPYQLNGQSVLSATGEETLRCVMKMETPDYLDVGENLDNTVFLPCTIITAVHTDLRISADRFLQSGYELSSKIQNVINVILEANKLDKLGLVFSTRFIMLKDYLQGELTRQFENQPDLLSKTRLQLHECVPPMSLHIGILRIALPNSSILLDILFDTTDTERNRSVFCHIIFDKNLPNIIEHIGNDNDTHPIGVMVEGF